MKMEMRENSPDRSIAPSVEMQVRLVYHNIRNGWLGLFVLLGSIMYIADSNHVDVQIWGMITASMAIGHGLLVHLFLRCDVRGEIINYQHWGRSVALYSLAAGMAVSIGASFAFTSDAIGWGYFLVALMTMPGFGSAVTSTSFLLVHICWVLGTNLPLGLYLLSLENEMFSAIGLLMIFAAIPMMLLLGVGYSGMYQRNIALQLKNIDLVQSLQIKAGDAEQANLDKSRFLAAASHDLRQPLYALDLYLGIMAREKNVQKHYEWLNKARQSSAALGELLNGLLDISRIDAGNINVEKRLIPLTPLLDECIAAFAQQADEKGIDLRMRAQHGACAITDPVLFGRIVRNLLSNAIRYTESGKVLLAVRRRSDCLRVEVWDTGAGIAENECEAIFSEFYQLGNSERNQDKGLGLGLGLAIVRRLSVLLDHRIDLRSQLGRGSCFGVSLTGCSTAGGCSQNMSFDPQYDLSGMFVLLVDDNEAILDAMRHWLRMQNCEVLAASSGRKMLEELEHLDYGRPDVIVSDYRLRDEENGVSVVASLRKFFAAHVPAIVISADTSANVMAMVKEADIQFLVKPVVEDQLINALAQYAANS